MRNARKTINFDVLEAEYNLIMQKKSNQSSNARKEIVDLYKQAVKCLEQNKRKKEIIERLMKIKVDGADV